MHFNYKAYIKAAGTLLFASALLLVAIKLDNNWQEISSLKLIIPVGWAIVLGSSLYCIISFLLSSAWTKLITLLDVNAIPVCWHSIYSRTQIGKYLPGNVFHFAGRHVLGTRNGVSHTALTGAAILEAAGLIGGACTVSLITLCISGPRNYGLSSTWYFSFLALVIAIPFVFKSCCKRSSVMRNLDVAGIPSLKLLKSLFPAFIRYFLFFSLSGVVLLGVLYLVTGWQGTGVAGAVMGIYATSWIAGFVVPGSPAGIGIRESLMVLSLTAFIGEANSLAVALIFRFITVTGDVLFFITSYFGRFYCKRL